MLCLSTRESTALITQRIRVLRYELAVKNDDKQTDYIGTEQWGSEEHFEAHIKPLVPKSQGF
jgi:hypothetical protein